MVKTKKKRRGRPLITGVYFGSELEQAIVYAAEVFDESRAGVVRTLVDGWCREDGDVEALTQDLTRAYGETHSRQLAARSKRVAERVANLERED